VKNQADPTPHTQYKKTNQRRVLGFPVALSAFGKPLTNIFNDNLRQRIAAGWHT
jgi:hypothetical protein